MSKMREPQVIMPTDPTANVTVRCPFPVDIPSRMKKNRLNNSAQNTPRDYPQKRKNTRKAVLPSSSSFRHPQDLQVCAPSTSPPEVNSDHINNNPFTNISEAFAMLDPSFS